MRAEMAAIEQQRITEALERFGGNQTRAAAYLKISRRTLLKRLDAYGATRPRKPRPEA
jgi:two-component system response regulator AtoC